jgi:hypothetical protein
MKVIAMLEGHFFLSQLGDQAEVIAMVEGHFSMSQVEVPDESYCHAGGTLLFVSGRRIRLK